MGEIEAPKEPPKAAYVFPFYQLSAPSVVAQKTSHAALNKPEKSKVILIME